MGLFDGLKILEFGAGAATPLASRYFAEQGARVVRVESAKKPDFLRVLALGPKNPHGLDGAPMFILLNTDKESVAVNLSTAEGVAIVRKLVAWCDVVTENFSPGVMAKLGLGYDALVRIKPDLIMVSGCLFGQTGPQRTYPGFGGQSSAIAGFNHLTGWSDREAVGPFGTISDSLAARYVGLVVAAALVERDRTGQGQYLDVSQIEACVYSLSEMVVRFTANGEIVTRSGNRDEQAAPHGVYPCRGDDRWIAIAIFSDEDWRTLGRVVDASWTRDPRFSTAQARIQHQEAIDRALGEWTRTFDPHELMARLQAAGVEAGVVQNYDDLLHDPQLAHRGHFRTVESARFGPMIAEQSGIVYPDSPRTLARPGPDLGAHTRATLAELLGLSNDEIDRLIENQVLV